MRKILLAVAALFYFATLHAQDSLSLEKAIEKALYNNYSIQIAQNNYEVAENNVTIGNAGFLPVVDLTANQNNAFVNGEQVTSQGAREIDNLKNKSTVFGGNVNWTVFDGRRMFFNYDRLQEIRLQSEAELRFAIESLIFNLSNVYYLAAQEQARLNSLMSNLELSEQRLEIAKNQYDVGRSSKIQYLQAQVDYNSDRSLILSQQELLAARKYELIQLMGVNDSINFNLEYNIDFPQQIILEELLNNVESQNPQLVSLRLANEVAILDKQMLQAERLPNVSVFTGYNYSEVQRNVGFSFTSSTNELSYGFSARWQIFNGFNLKRQIENSKILIENTQLQLENQKLSIITQLKTAFIRYQNNLELMKLEDQNLEVAEENYVIAQERNRIGLSNALELREAQVNLVDAEIRFQNAAFAAKRAEAELMFLSGAIDKTPNQ